MSLTTLRKEIRKLGFKLKTESTSFGTLATYIHIESNQALTFNCAPKSTWEKWEALRDFCTKQKEMLSQIQTKEQITGLLRPCK